MADRWHGRRFRENFLHFYEFLKYLDNLDILETANNAGGVLTPF